MPLGVPVVPLVHRKIPPDPDPGDAPAGLTACSVSGHAPGPFGPCGLSGTSGGVSTARPGGTPEPESHTAASGRATASTRATSAAGAAGSSGTTTRPAARMLTSAAAYPSGSGRRTATRAPGGNPARSRHWAQPWVERCRPA